MRVMSEWRMASKQDLRAQAVVPLLSLLSHASFLSRAHSVILSYTAPGESTAGRTSSEKTGLLWNAEVGQWHEQSALKDGEQAKTAILLPCLRQCRRWPTHPSSSSGHE